jgi:2-methylisocitrate lyase-like PEP mutase family enzyme
MDQASKASLFRELHVRGRPLLLFNIWDAGSARTVAAAGAVALATGSWSVAAALGMDDGEAVPLALVLENLARIVRAVELPVSLDFEGGYGATPAEVGASVGRATGAGAIGFNIEDSLMEGRALREVTDAAARIAAARAAADAAGVPVVLNARTDVFMGTPGADHAGLVDAALARGAAYAAAGADCLFVPGLSELALIREVAARSVLPINIMASAKAPALAELAAAGVARVSHGPGPWRLAMAALGAAAETAFGR